MSWPKTSHGGQRHGNGEEHRPIPPLIHRQVAHELSGLSVHGKKEVLAAPFRIEHPHGYERVTASLFYRWKLKEPLAVLMDGTNRMMENDLDFIIPAVSGDELEQLCVTFETMRQSLLNSNRELWRQTEERKRLNAAFSHDLRNPITVLKGSAKMAKQCADCGNTPQLMDNLERMEAYTGRIERYVETMSKVQRLEQVQLEKRLLTPLP